MFAPSETCGVIASMSKNIRQQESDEPNQIQRTHAMSVDAEMTFEDTCSRSLLDAPDAALRLHNNLHLLEIVAEQDEAEATAGISLTPTNARRLATRLLTMSTGGYIEDLETDRSNGCTRIRVSQSWTAYRYDDEQDSIVAGEREMNVEEAEQLRDDLDVALEALSEEEVRR